MPSTRRGRRVLYLGLVLVGLLVVRFFPRPAIGAAIPHSQVVVASDGQLLRLTLAGDGQYRVWTTLSEVSPILTEATLNYEDRFYYWHPGFNPVALVRAAIETYLKRQHRPGGSTITMQVARRLYQIDSRTIGGKFHQLAAALWLELRYSKRAILEAYLNLAPYGGNIEGIAAASRIHFAKSPSALTRAEALTLAVIPQDPAARGVPLLKRVYSKELREARLRLAQRLGRRGTDQHLPKLYGTEALPFLAPHLVDSLLADPTLKQPRIETTVDLKLQTLIERQVALHIARLRRVGVHNAAAMLVDSQTMAVEALVGSADYFDKKISGQVNGSAAPAIAGIDAQAVCLRAGDRPGDHSSTDVAT